MMSKQKRILLILGVLATLILAIVAIVTAVRLQQIGTQPVAPSVPKSKPRAAVPEACLKSWTIVEAPPATPTLVPDGLTCHDLDGQPSKVAYRNDPRNTPGSYFLEDRILDGGTVNPGETIVYKMFLRNTGGTTITGAQIRDVLSTAFNVVDKEPICTFQASTRMMKCTLGDVAPGGIDGAAFRVKVKSTAAVGALRNEMSLFRQGFTVPDDSCAIDLAVVRLPTQTPTPTRVPGATNTPTPAGSTVICTDLDVPSGTSRKQNENISFICKGSPPSKITQCRFRFGDETPEVFEDDCNVIKSYPTTGQYATSCEVRDTDGYWRASSACEETIEIVSGPTNTPAPGATAYPTNQQSAPKPSTAPRARTTAIPTVPEQSLPNAGGIGQTVGVVIGGIGVLLLGLLMLL